MMNVLTLVFTAALLGAEPPDQAGLELFENEIRPLLAENCFKCHGARKQESGLRWDHVSYALAGGGRGPALVVGDPSASLVLSALRHDGDLEMPPSGRLSEREIRAVERWIELGAPWAGEKETGGLRHTGQITDEDRAFWSFQPVVKAEPPTVKDTSWPQTPVDRFILSRIEDAGIPVGHRAEKHALLRRVTYDMTGLPPASHDLREFLEDERPDAYARVVDRLLASPAYGERWGRHWLDVVRYADTAGETADYPVREAYRYRNYVIDSLNADKPYDEFVREQVAGDILARRGPRELYAERMLATGFIAISRRFGYDSERYHHLTIQDTVDTVGQAFLGLSIGCARCHHHKFDPVSTEDYYGLYGIFASTRYSFPGSEEKKRVRSMLPLLPPDEAEPLQVAYEARLGEIEAELRQLAGKNVWRFGVKSIDDLDGDFERQSAARGGGEGVTRTPWRSSGGVSVSEASISPYTSVHNIGRVGVNLQGDRADNRLSQYLPRALRRGDGTYNLNLEFQVVRSLPVLNLQGAIIRRLEPEEPWSPDSISGAYRFFVGEQAGESAAFSFTIGADRFRVDTVPSGTVPGKGGGERTLKPDTWYSVQVALDLDRGTYDGSIGLPGDRTPFSGPLPGDWSGTIDHLVIAGTPATGQLKPLLDIDNIAFRRTPLVPPTFAEDLKKFYKSAKEPRQEDEAPRTVTSAEEKRRKARYTALNDERAILINDGPYPSVYGVTEGLGRDAHVQQRGEPLRVGPRVPRRFLEVLGADPIHAGVKGSGRLELAESLTRESNPLTARVIVNRLWQHHFGDGLVRTENDFGTRGEKPSHPQLLDYLAIRLVENGWSLKSIHRLILLSATYQLSAAPNAEGLRLDPEERLHWRFRRRRLDAESLRDSLLAFGGNLEPAMGGYHPFPSFVKKSYSQHGPFRAVYPSRQRSVYLMTQRTKAHPYLALFDGADPSATTAKRSTSIVPTQALFLMNNAFVHEQSLGMARQLVAASTSPRQRIAMAFERALARPPSTEETAHTLEFLDLYESRLDTDLVALAPGTVQEERSPPTDPAIESLAAFVRTLFARNEFLYLE